MFNWIREQWNSWTGGSRPATRTATSDNTNHGDTWHMDPASRIATNDRTHERAYVAALVPHTDANGNATHQYEPIPQWIKTKYPDMRVFSPREGHPMFAFDAGHGVQKDMRNGDRAIDFGTESSDHRYQEANITLDYANTAARHMNARGGDVLITRTDKIYRHLDDPNKDHAPYAREGFNFRLAAANHGFAGYVSFHVNHAENGEARGTRLYADRRASAVSESSSLLDFLRPNARHALRPANQRSQPAAHVDEAWDYIQDAQVRRPGFMMIDGNRIPQTPAVLLEVGFISNPMDARNILSRNHINGVTRELVSDLWNFNARRAATLGNEVAHTSPHENTGLAQLWNEISGRGNPHHSSITLASLPNTPRRGPTSQR